MSKEANNTTFTDKLKMYLAHPGSMILMLLVMLSAIITFTILIFLIAYILCKTSGYHKPGKNNILYQTFHG